jgi:GTP-binding protein Era
MGKSTLLNALLSDDLAIATSRPQTTRHAILGVMTTDYSQICLTDTPGIIGNPAYRLQEGMMDVVNGAVRDCDVFLVVTDVYSGGKMDSDDDNDDDNSLEKMGIGEDMLMKLKQSQRPVIVVVNKVDLVADTDESVYTNTPVKAIQTIQKWRSVLPDAFAIIPTCAANGPDDQGVVALRSILLANDPDVNVGAAIRNLGRPVVGMFAANLGGMPTNEEAKAILPLGPPLYHADFFTDRTDRFCASELIRETLFESFKKELPYCTEVRIETFDESKRYLDEESSDGGSNKTKNKSMIRIGAVILVERDSQKGIVVGKGGQKIKDVGVDARRKLQAFFGVKIFLDLRVKVDKNWRDNKDKLKQYGYM